MNVAAIRVVPKFVLSSSYSRDTYHQSLALCGAMCGSLEALAALEVRDLKPANELVRVHDRDLADLATAVVEGGASVSSPGLAR